MRRIASLAVTAILVAAPAIAQNKNNAMQLANELEKISDVCSSKASAFYHEESLAETKLRLDSDLERMQIRQDAEVYGVGHGRQQTQNYYLERLGQKQASDREKSAQLAEGRRQSQEEVAACVTDALDKGKSLYSSFKKNKKTAELANQVMTSWLVNTQTIGKGSPRGTRESEADWKKAKASAELDSL